MKMLKEVKVLDLDIEIKFCDIIKYWDYKIVILYSFWLWLYVNVCIVINVILSFFQLLCFFFNFLCFDVFLIFTYFLVKYTFKFVCIWLYTQIKEKTFCARSLSWPFYIVTTINFIYIQTCVLWPLWKISVFFGHIFASVTPSPFSTFSLRTLLVVLL